MASGKAGVHVIQLKPILVSERLQQGCKFVKWDDDSTIGTHVTLYIDSKGFFLYWKDVSNEIEYLEISSIRDTRTGRYARVPREGRLRDSCNIGLSEIPLDERTFTVVYGPDFVNTSFINFVAPNREDAVEWTDAVLKMAYNLLALNSSPFTLLAKAHTKIRLMVDREGRIPVKNLIKLFAQHKDDKKRVEKALDFTNIPTGKSSSFDPDKFPLETFLQFYKHLVVRSEVDKIFDRLISAGEASKNANDHPRLMTVDQFVDFLNKEQRDPRLNEILYPYADRAKGIELISQYEPSKANIEKDCISADGFLRYLMSDDNAIVAPEKFDHNLDMNQPLNHYFINSSHNTYLTGHQLTGKSSVEIYRQCLLAGCRCIELDCWNGRNSDEEPIITHGYTVVSDVPCKDVLEAIAETAFKTSVYPVILSFENHCSTRQQAKIAQYCRKIFGETLLTEPLPNYPLKPGVSLPSPNALMRKILIKNKKKHSKKRKHKRGSNITTGTSTTSNVALSSGDVLSSVSGPTTRADVTSTVSSSDTLATITSGLPLSTPERRLTLQPNNSDESSTLEREDSSQIADYDDCLTGQTGGVSGSGTSQQGTVTNNNKRIPASCDIENDNDSDSSLDDEDAGPPSEAGGGTSGGSIGEQIDGDVVKEAEACDDMSAIVNYIQPVNFVSFEHSEKRNRSYEISSFVEATATNYLKERPVDFVNLNKVQLSRIYPKGTRVDSSNYMPQVFWNAGCQMVALNFQTLDLGMQLNLGIFEYNGRSGYLLKPDFMNRLDKKFDPFTESTVDGIIAGTVSVKIISGIFLSDKRTGTFVEVDMFGLPADTVRRKRTKTVPNNGINPIYDDEPFIFKKIVLPDLACLRVSAYEEGGKLIGHRILPVVGLRPGYRHIALRNESGQSLTLPTLFVHITVKDYVPDGLSELADALANPIAYQSMAHKRAKQLLALTDEKEEDSVDGVSGTGPSSGSGLTNAATTSAKVVVTGDSSERKSNVTDDGRRTSTGIFGSSSSKHESMNGTVSATPGRNATTSSSVAHSSQIVSSSPAHPSSVPPLIRQDTISLRKNQSVRSLSDEAASEKMVYLLEIEAENFEPESLEALKQHKDVVKVTRKLEEELASLRKKFEKTKAKEVDVTQKKEDKIMGSQSKQRYVLGKKLSRKPSTDARSMMKRLSEVDLQQTSSEKAEKLEELHRTLSESMVKIILEQYQIEKNLLDKYHEKYYAALEVAMQTSQSNQEQELQKLHSRDVNSLQRRIDAQIKEVINSSGKKFKDKNEANRVRREQQSRLVDQAVIERQRLDSILKKRKAELATRHKLIQKELTEDKLKAKENLDHEYQAKCDALQEEFRSNTNLFMENWTLKK
ncbi:1-phosphatidylinositol 4,5-bisphosphate phosphodiesterase classes I and II [Tetranychus urticae]|uniref:1-phosphatidylinositol 4,5-bisphosphate phosphodiesterase classes I and II n=1 Tax=Tetranychus urticae TaxID=32264 RepID=UPI00077C0741|nr:1-phosphatidylinositol 4,5-bisphosphate phosphodiesterase classes I and II [Tetranychus urticae]